LFSYDIAWGNFVTRFGIIGSVIFIYIWYILIQSFWIYRKYDGIILCMFIYCIQYYIDSLASSYISTAGSFIFPFIIYGYIYATYKSKYSISNRSIREELNIY
jgi:hypothetical protein